ncbi:MAG: NERD domain-containing protein [Alkalibacterium sp.]|nr:NERD domain-containing protein [Alkalibacterium sp.]
MEVMKMREEPILLAILNALSKRMTLSYEEKQSKINMEKGFIGEMQFDQLMTESAESEAVVLQDLLLRIKGNSVQVDALMLTQDVVYLYEIKNYDGEYVMKSGQLYTVLSQEISNPLTQLNRTSSLLRQLFQSWSINMTIEANIVFVNPSFMLYQANPDDPIIFLNQIKRHFFQISQQQAFRSGLPKKVTQLAERLSEKHQKEVPFQKQLPDYNYDGLRKGLLCRQCGSFEVEVTQRSCRCERCGYKETLDEVILCHIKEYKLLFPQEKVTTNLIYEWCAKSVTKKRIQQILNKYYRKKGQTIGTFYD